MPDIKKEFKGREVISPSQLELERIQEKVAEYPAVESEAGIKPTPIQLEPLAPIKSPVVDLKPAVTPLQSKIEDILQEDLVDLYRELSSEDKQRFKIKGEATASKISQLLAAVKIRVQEIVKLLIEWLKVLPGVNKYFIEQEAKIKADKILKLKR
ncbi:MAG: hypothetical protein V1712_03470 [Patescibacteria group bacterium]